MAGMENAYVRQNEDSRYERKFITSSVDIELHCKVDLRNVKVNEER